MKVSVFGGTGAIGQELVEELLFRGFEVTAFMPESAPVPITWSKAVRVENGMLTDAAAVDTAVAGSAAVINALDPRLRPRDQDLVVGTGHIVASMHHHRIRRYIGYGTPVASLCPKERPTTPVRIHRFLARHVDPRAYQQMVSMLETVTGSGMDWTIVRFLHLSRGPGRGLKYVGYFGEDIVGSPATAADIAGFTVTQVLGTDYIRDTPAVSH